MTHDTQAPHARILPDAPAAAAAAARWLAAAIAERVAETGSCTVALSGGETPRGLFRALAAAPGADAVDWARVSVYFADERAVPPDDPRSNYGLARRELLAKVPIPAAQVHRMPGERPDRDAAAREYERLLPGRLDVLVLGVGPDGHTASLFPHHPALDERARRVVAVAGAPFPPPDRLTITPPVIAAARRVLVLATGDAKARAVSAALDVRSDPRRTPAALAAGGVWFLDAPAARLLENGST